MLMWATIFCSIRYWRSFGDRPLAHADERDRRTQGDLGDAFANIGGKHAFGAYLEPRVPGDAVDAVIVEAMDDGPNPLGRVADACGDVTVANTATGQQHDPCVQIVHTIGALMFHTEQTLLFMRAQRA